MLRVETPIVEGTRTRILGASMYRAGSMHGLGSNVVQERGRGNVNYRGDEYEGTA